MGNFLISNQVDLCEKIHRHLRSGDAENANSRFQEAYLKDRLPGTCDWLLEDKFYVEWASPTSFACPVLCISAPPGWGKSVLSSVAIEQIKRGAAVAFYYCQLSQPCSSEYELLRLLAFQLFNVYFTRKLPVHNDICQQVICCSTTEHIQALIVELVKSLAPVYFFVDGLDEAQGGSRTHVSNVLKFLREKICDSLPAGMARLWCTKRRQPRAVECYKEAIEPYPHSSLEIGDHTEADVVRYLHVRFAALEKRLNDQMTGGLPELDRKVVRLAENYLFARSKGNFLWARLMTQDFEGDNRIESVNELMDAVVNAPLPKDLDELYTTIFSRISQKNRKIAA